MAKCSQCGRKGFFLKLHFFDDSSQGLCAECFAEEKRRREEQEERERRRNEEYSARCKAMEDDYEKFTYGGFDLLSGLSKAEEFLAAGNRFVYSCEQASKDEEFIIWLTEMLKTTSPFGYRGSYRDNAKNYLFMAKCDVLRAVDKIEDLISNSRTFAKTLAELPRLEITLSDSAYFPDIEPDYAGVKYTNITKRTNVNAISDYIAVDVETTGLNAYKCHIIQIAAVRFREFEPVDCFMTYIKPPNKIPSRITAINGITNDMVADAPTIDRVINAFRKYVGDKQPLVGHNLSFDVKFLCNNGCISLNNKRKYFDTLELSRLAYKYDESEYSYRANKYSLDCIDKAALLIDREGAHDALSDSLVTGMLFADIVKTRTSD